MRTIRITAIASALLVASVDFVPLVASILSFITYSLTKHDLNVAIIFTSLQFLNIIREPLIFLPIVLHSCSDAVVAIGRIQKYLNAEELPEPYRVNATNDNAVEVDGDFRWETTAKELQARIEAEANEDLNESRPSTPEPTSKDTSKDVGKTEELASGKAQSKRRWFRSKEPSTPVLPVSSPVEGEANDLVAAPDTVEEDKPFALSDLKLAVPKGAFVAIIGRIGSGKSSLLQSMIGEMRKTRGDVQFGGSVAYVPQSAWIMNATLR